LFIIYLSFYKTIKLNRDYFNKLYSKIQSDINIKFNNNINKIIRIAIYTINLKDGGVQRFTSKFINIFDKIKLFHIYLFNQKEKEENEYKISDNIKRVFIKNASDINSLIKQIKKNKIDIFIYQFPIQKEIHALNIIIILNSYIKIISNSARK
jgi:predicted O-linked N-acetylglucosamine transferase (SPINDLY family)